jgi:hypothetical protein
LKNLQLATLGIACLMALPLAAVMMLVEAGKVGLANGRASRPRFPATWMTA